jgi:hypothetical protein
MKIPTPTILFSIAIFLLITSLLIFFVGPELIQSRYYAIKPENRGTMGDAFGGTMGPVIAWIAAILTFAAFYIQYEANKEQREQFKKQANDIAMQRFENIYFEMIKLHKENVNEMNIEGYDLIETVETDQSNMLATFPTKKTKTKQEIGKDISGRKVFVTTYVELKACHEICKHTLSFESFPNKERYLIEMAYNFLYNGAGSDIVTQIDTTVPKDTDYVKMCKDNLNLASRQHVSSSGKGNVFKIPKSNILVPVYIKYKPFSGHASRFGHYYRHLFQMVKYVVSQKNELLNYSAKREYLRILRAQLSDQEQAMLYFNYLSKFGANWENKSNKYFSEYRMIHNMPLHMSDFTIKPTEEFKKQIETIRQQGEEMFEAFE